MQAMPHTADLPITQPEPVDHAAAIAQWQGQFLSRNAGAQDIDDAIEGVLPAARPQ